MAAEKQAVNGRKCMIIGAAPISGREIFREFDPRQHFVICADAGFETAGKYGIRPDLIVGDFDSAGRKPGEDENTVIIPVEKDVTDTMYAVLKGFSLGFTEFVLLGCLGGERFDHSIANLEVLQYILAHGGQGVLADETTRIFLLKENRLRVTESKGVTVSVFPYNGTSCTVTYKGMKYPLYHETLTCGGLVMGVSNCVTEERAEILVHEGTALVIFHLK